MQIKLQKNSVTKINTEMINNIVQFRLRLIVLFVYSIGI